MEAQVLLQTFVLNNIKVYLISRVGEVVGGTYLHLLISTILLTLPTFRYNV